LGISPEDVPLDKPTNEKRVGRNEKGRKDTKMPPVKKGTRSMCRKKWVAAGSCILE